jgi:addiction module HigA family antidote
MEAVCSGRFRRHFAEEGGSIGRPRTHLMKTRLAKRLHAIHPGEILLEDFMKPLAISINRLARDLDVPPNQISAIVNGTRSITADTALRLGTYFRVSPETWLGLQIDYDLRVGL